MENTTEDRFAPDEDGCVTIGDAKFWPTYELARIHKTYDPARRCSVVRWMKSRDRFITLYC